MVDATRCSAYVVCVCVCVDERRAEALTWSSVHARVQIPQEFGIEEASTVGGPCLSPASIWSLADFIVLTVESLAGLYLRLVAIEQIRKSSALAARSKGAGTGVNRKVPG